MGGVEFGFMARTGKRKVGTGGTLNSATLSKLKRAKGATNAKKKNRAARIWSLDTEDDSKGTVSLITFYDGEVFHTFRSREEAIAFLSKQKSRIQIWCTNLGYDLANLFGEWLHCLEITYVESRVISAKVVGTQIHFRDTLNHWKISVSEMGKRIGLEKLEVKNKNYDDVAYNQRDAEITHTFVSRMSEYYSKIGCKLKATIGSTSLEYFFDHYGTRNSKRFFQKEDIEFMLRGYYGGRTEIFFTKPVEGNIQYWDYNSLYPRCMMEMFPQLTGHRRLKINKGEKPDLENAEGIASVQIRSPLNMPVPYLPYRDPDSGSLVFPVGVFKGFYTYFELREAQKLGYDILKVYAAIEFPEGRYKPFENFVTTLYDKRLEAKKVKDELLSDSYKLILNNLYGKFAQGNELSKLMPYQPGKLKHGDTLYGSMVLRTVRGDYPKHSNIIWSAYVTAYGRHRLWLGMRTVVDRGGLLIYCDTDSIIFESSKRIFRDSSELGELKSEGIFSYAHFKLPKLYKLVSRDDEKSVYRAKGVPRAHAESFFETGRATFERPFKLKEALRRSGDLVKYRDGIDAETVLSEKKKRNLNAKRRKIIPNYWELTEKETGKIYDKRRCKSTGHTEPLRING